MSYPRTSYAWRKFRAQWCDDKRQQRTSIKRKKWDGWVDAVSTDVRRSLPKRYRHGKSKRELQSSMLAYHKALHGDLFFCGPSAIHGTGVFAAANLAPGDYLDLSGECRQISNKRQHSLELSGEHSFWKGSYSGNRVEYFGGPLSLVNHACPPANNAEFLVLKDSPAKGHKQVAIKLLKRLAPGEEILVDYGEGWWINREEEGIKCKCPACLQKIVGKK